MQRWLVTIGMSMCACVCWHSLIDVHTYREHHSRTPETLPRLKRWFTGRHSSHRIQRSVSMRVHSSTKSHTVNSSVRSFATQSFSGADKMKDRVIHDKPVATSVLTTKRLLVPLNSESLFESPVCPQKYISNWSTYWQWATAAWNWANSGWTTILVIHSKPDSG